MVECFNLLALLWVSFFGLIPAVLGYFAGRRFPLWERFIPPITILAAGGYWVAGSGHGFEYYLWANAAYVIACATGVYFRSRAQDKPFWRMMHLDWISIALGTAVLWKYYRHPPA
jgi:hypothetical protein